MSLTSRDVKILLDGVEKFVGVVEQELEDSARTSQVILRTCRELKQMISHFRTQDKLNDRYGREQGKEKGPE